MFSFLMTSFYMFTINQNMVVPFELKKGSALDLYAIIPGMSVTLSSSRGLNITIYRGSSDIFYTTEKDSRNFQSVSFGAHRGVIRIIATEDVQFEYTTTKSEYKEGQEMSLVFGKDEPDNKPVPLPYPGPNPSNQTRPVVPPSNSTEPGRRPCPHHNSTDHHHPGNSTKPDHHHGHDDHHPGNSTKPDHHHGHDDHHHDHHHGGHDSKPDHPHHGPNRPHHPGNSTKPGKPGKPSKPNRPPHHGGGGGDKDHGHNGDNDEDIDSGFGYGGDDDDSDGDDSFFGRHHSGRGCGLMRLVHFGFGIFILGMIFLAIGLCIRRIRINRQRRANADDSIPPIIDQGENFDQYIPAINPYPGCVRIPQQQQQMQQQPMVMPQYMPMQPQHPQQQQQHQMQPQQQPQQYYYRQPQVMPYYPVIQ